VSYEWSACKLADAMDFFHPHTIEHITSVGEHPRFHCKQWEFAQLLEVRRRYAPTAKRMIGLGVGCEKTLPLLAEGAEEVIATDRYDAYGDWEEASRRPDEVYPELDNLRVHDMDMLDVDLPERSADFVWSMCAVEHVGGVDEVADAVRQAGELLDDDGLMFISTEFNLGSKPYRTKGTLFLDPPMIEEVIRKSGLFLMDPIRLELSRHPFNTPVWSGVVLDYPVGHILYRDQPNPLRGTIATVVAFVLQREDKGVPIFQRDPAFDERVRQLEAKGRVFNRRLAPLRRWW
jgi:SAM-dependent methyltransferase